MIKKIHHVGIVVGSLARAYPFWRDALGLPVVREAEIADQGVRAALLAAGDSEIELLEPTKADTGVARFLARHGEGLHHVCFETPDVGADLGALKAQNVALLDQTPRQGLAGRIAFLHPSACGSVLDVADAAFARCPECDGGGRPCPRCGTTGQIIDHAALRWRLPDEEEARDANNA